MVFEREKTEKTNGDRELARTEKSLLYALSIRAATERKRNGYYLSGGSYPSPSANLRYKQRARDMPRAFFFLYQKTTQKLLYFFTASIIPPEFAS